MAAPVSAAVQGVMTPRPPRTANTAVAEVQAYFLQVHSITSSCFIVKNVLIPNKISPKNMDCFAITAPGEFFLNTFHETLKVQNLISNHQ